jgi:hypothetical protein
MKEPQQFEWRLDNPGTRRGPPDLAEHLWGVGVNCDSEGNSDTHSDWTELYLAKRPDCEESVDIWELSEHPLVLGIRSGHAHLARRTAEFLAKHCGGQLSLADQSEGPTSDESAG